MTLSHAPYLLYSDGKGNSYGCHENYLLSRAVPFGEAAPDATQFFEAYRVEGDACIWEAF